MVIDAHVHIGTGDGLHGPWDTAAPLSLYLDRARPAGIRGAVIMAPLTSDYPKANATIAALIRDRPGLLGYLFINARSEAGTIQQRVAHAVGQGFCGIKVHAHDARITREIAEAARRWRLPVLYDPAGDTATVEMVVRSYPDVAWVVPHLSSFADDWKAQCAFVDQLVRLPNLFTDTSGVRYFDLLEDAARRAGPGKILFGSDGPFLHPAVELAKARALPFDTDGMAQVLSGNVLRLTGPARLRFRGRRPAVRRRVA
ncbi:amidohydrolase [Nocardioides cavernaquae]|uniref:Amidohydrolase n=1 Tax=Nocardioides cavernaquae TaxID=2321396 RepID=A0A3A5HDM1_9ACTN|nr:amidohydrolase [Nocardioides cavernaquae]